MRRAIVVSGADGFLPPAGHRANLLYTFTGGNDGYGPTGGVIRDSAGNLYGTTPYGGAAGAGVVFKLDTAGQETVLYTFTGGSDGGYPYSGLVRDSAGNLYGTTYYGGDLGACYGSGCGIVFKIDPVDQETVLYSFMGGPDGAYPNGVIRDSAGNLYGTDGNITVTYVDQNSAPSNTIHFVMCKPNGAPSAPVCSAPVVVANENQALGPSVFGGSLSGLNLTVFTAARHADRLESDGKTTTTFVVWDRCQTIFGTPSPGSFATCLNAQVVMSASTNGGATWSAPVPVNTSPGHQFFPWISTDTSTGTVNIVYYNTAPDFFHKRIVVSLNQIAAGNTTVGAPIGITSSPAAWDADPTQNPFAIGFDYHFGMKARGNGTAGHSRVYASFTSTADRRAIYSGSQLPKQNNNLQRLAY